MSGITVRAVKGDKDLLRFIRFPWRIYDGNTKWVPPLIADRKKLLDREKNPFFEHAEMELFLAERDGQIVGRIGAIVNHLHNSFHKENMGFFGFFESIEDRDVSTALFDAGKKWLISKGAERMRGPTSPSMNDECGLLIEGFDKSPTVLMPYNPPYYSALIESYGLRKVMDLYGYQILGHRVEGGRVLRLAEMVRKRESVHLRLLDMKRFRRDVELVKEIYNEAWQTNWGFVPMTNEEIDYMAADLKHIIIPDFALFAEVNGRTVGFVLGLLDYNFVLRRIRNGRLFPFGILKVLLNRSKIKLVRIVIAGVIKEYQKRGIDALFYSEMLKRGKSRGIHEAEASWILESNKMMQGGLEALDAIRTKTYRMYEMRIN